MSFPELSSKLKSVWQSIYANAEEEKSMQRGMVLNRGWGESPESSVELLGGFEEQDSGQKKGITPHQGASENMNGLSNTELFGFPGLLFEVLKNDAVSCLTVY
jgi:isoleucyl-tRNA synthetase